MIPNHLPLVVLLVVIPCDTACANDTKSPKPSELVRLLSWGSIEGNCMGGSLCFRPGGEPAEKLVKMGEAANEALLSVLDGSTSNIRSVRAANSVRRFYSYWASCKC